MTEPRRYFRFDSDRGAAAAAAGTAAAAVLLCAPAAAAEDDGPISAERPGFTAGVDTVPSGRIQLEIGAAYSGSGGSHLAEIGDGAQLRFPLSDRAEVRLGLPSYQWAHESGERTQSGFQDTLVSAKFRFLDGIPGRRPGLALIPGIVLPNTGAKAFRRGSAQPSVAFEAHYDFSALWSVEMDWIYASARGGANRRFDQRSGAVNVGYAITPAVGAFLEAYRINPTDFGGPTGNYLDGGFTCVTDRGRTQYDIGAGRGVTSGVRSDFFVSAGCARRF